MSQGSCKVERYIADDDVDRSALSRADGLSPAGCAIARCLVDEISKKEGNQTDVICGVRATKDGYEMEEHFRFDFNAQWTDFAQRVVISLLKFGIAVWDLAENEHLILVPIVYDFETLDVRFEIKDFDRRIYTVWRNGKRLRSARVLDKYPPARDGGLTSPMAMLIPMLKRLEKISELALEAMTDGVRPMKIIERVPDRRCLPSGSKPPYDFGPSGDGVSTLSLDGASLANKRMPFKMNSDDAQRKFNELLGDLETPAEMVEIEESKRKAMVLGDNFHFVSGDGRAHPYVPSATETEKALELAISSSFGIPRVYWSEMESRFQVELHLARDKLKSSIRHWSVYITELLQSIWAKIYGKNDAFMEATIGAPITRITLPATVQLYEFEYMLNNGMIDQLTFNANVSSLFGWRGVCGEVGSKIAVHAETKEEKSKTTARIRKGLEQISRKRKTMWEKESKSKKEELAKLFPPAACTTCGALSQPAQEGKVAVPPHKKQKTGTGLNRPEGKGTMPSRRGTVESGGAPLSQYERQKQAAARAAATSVS